LTLIRWLTGILQERVYQKSVKDVDDLKLRLIEARSDIHQRIVGQATDQWRIFVSMHETPKESTLNTCYDVLLHNCQQFVVGFETDIAILLQNFIRVLTFFSLDCLSLNNSDFFIEFRTIKNAEN